MPSEEQHDEKYRANRAFLALHGGDDPCWDATIAFYCALHLVERLAALEGKHNSAHVGNDSRHDYLKRHPEHYVIETPYWLLFQASMLGRYDALSDFEDKYDAQSVRMFLIDHCLVAIETYVAQYFAAGGP